MIPVGYDLILDNCIVETFLFKMLVGEEEAFFNRKRPHIILKCGLQYKLRIYHNILDDKEILPCKICLVIINIGTFISIFGHKFICTFWYYLLLFCFDQTFAWISFILITHFSE
jgi:hypothetical protein